MEGWALALEGRAVGAEISCQGQVLQRVRFNVVRRDIAALYTGVPGSENCGFRTTVSIAGRPHDLLVSAILRGGRRAVIGRIGVEGLWRETARPPIVSVVIADRRDANLLRRSIESVLGQSYPHVEVVVVGQHAGGVAPDLEDVFPSVLFVREDPGGLAAARNRGIRESSGDFLAFLEAGDRLLPTALESGLGVFRERPGCALVAGHSGSRRTVQDDIEQTESCAGEDAYSALLRQSFFPSAAAVLYRRDLFGSVGYFAELPAGYSEYDLHLRAASLFPFICHHGLVAEPYGDSRGSSDPIATLVAARRVLRAQRRVVNGDGQLRSALREGGALVRLSLGRDVARLIRSSIRSHRWKRGISGLKAIAIHDPRSLRWLTVPNDARPVRPSEGP